MGPKRLWSRIQAFRFLQITSYTFTGCQGEKYETIPLNRRDLKILMQLYEGFDYIVTWWGQLLDGRQIHENDWRDWE